MNDSMPLYWRCDECSRVYPESVTATVVAISAMGGRTPTLGGAQPFYMSEARRVCPPCKRSFDCRADPWRAECEEVGDAVQESSAT